MKLLGTLQGKMIQIVGAGASFTGKLVDFDEQIMRLDVVGGGSIYVGIANVGYICELVTKA